MRQKIILMPSYTIGICAYNEQENVGKLLERVLSEKVGNLRKVVVVAGGNDRTFDLVADFAARERIVDVVRDVGKGKSSAMNEIIKRSVGEFVVFISGDNLPSKGSIEEMLTSFKPGVVAVVGRPKPSSKNRLENLLWELHHQVARLIPKISGEMFAVRKESLREIPENVINDDAYLTSMLKEEGRIVYVPSAVTNMIDDSGLRDFFRRRRRIAIGFIQLKKRGLRGGHVPLTMKVKLVLKSLKRGTITALMGLVFLEILAVLMAYIDYYRGFIPYNWRARWMP
ncbi:MAG TPA: glycosyltransferase [Candidatus Aenigmarchaeota archaeon]|nr:glycosyltransferase [Candidatus Aenigmarchaeota archaeon]